MNTSYFALCAWNIFAVQLGIRMPTCITHEALVAPTASYTSLFYYKYIAYYSYYKVLTY